MSDDRRHAPPPGVPIRIPAAETRTATTRVPPRDTLELVRDVQRDVEGLGERVGRDLAQLAERIDARLANGAEAFTRFDERVAVALERAREADRRAEEAKEIARAAAAAKPIPWLRVVPIITSILVLAGTVVVSMDRKPGREELDALEAESVQRATALAAELRDLDRRMAADAAKAETLRTVLETVARAIARPDPQPRRKP